MDNTIPNYNIIMLKFILFILIHVNSTFLYSQKIDPNFWITDGTVSSIIDDEYFIYFGGNFTNVGKSVSRGILISRDSVFVNPESKSIINGIVYSSFSDNNGKIYFSGDFNNEFGNLTSKILRINSNGSLDTSFNVEFEKLNLKIYQDSIYLYVSSYFEYNNQNEYKNIYRINLLNNTIDQNWNPFNERNFMLQGIDSNYFYLSEKIIDKINNDSYKILKYDRTNNDFVKNWEINFYGILKSIYFTDNDLYLYGSIGVVKSNSGFLIKVDKSTNTIDTNLNIKINSEVNSYRAINNIVFDDDYIYIAGKFTQVNEMKFDNIARINRTNFELDTNFKIQMKGDLVNGEIHDFDIIDNNIFLVGSFTEIANTNIKYLAKINKFNVKIDTFWNYKINNKIYTLSKNKNQLFIGGKFSSYNSTDVSCLFRVKKNNFDLDTSWKPIISNVGYTSINKLLIDKEYLYIAGYFTKVNNKTVNYLARLFKDKALNDIAWEPRSNGVIYDMAVDENDIYVVGQFSIIGGRQTYNLAKLNKINGNLDNNWRPLSDRHNINTLAIDKDFVYIGGDFNNIENKTNKNYARIDKTIGIIEDNTIFSYLKPTGSKVNRIIVDETDIYLLGKFYTEKSNSNYLVNLDKNNNIINNEFYNNLYLEGNTVLIEKDNLYIGFYNKTNYDRCFINKNKVSGEINKSWDFNFTNNEQGFKFINSIYKTDDYLILGGVFSSVNGIISDNLAKFDIIKPRFLISGYVFKDDYGIENIKITNGISTVLTDKVGYFKFDSLLTGEYNVYPLTNRYIYTPDNYIVNLDSNINNLNFELSNKVDNFELKNNVLYSDNIEGLKYSLINLLGQVIKKDNLEYEINFNNISGGVYILYISRNDKIIWSNKLCIIK